MVATDGQWYLSLKKPSWQPPNIVFGIIWPYNFAMLVGATWIVATRLSTTHRLIWLIFLALSVTSSLIWAWLFFMSHLLLASSIALLFATLFTTPLLVISFQASPALGIAFVPYQIWLALATSLSFGYSDQ
jgi:tryptophan-rich sensory protein